MDDNYVVIAVEDSLSEAVVRRLLQDLHCHVLVHRVMGLQGISWLKSRTQQFIEASKAVPHIVLIDLDAEDCAPGLLQDWFRGQVGPGLLARVAVREVEAWLLADRHGFAKFSGTAVTKIPLDTDAIADPKQHLISLFRAGKKQRMASEIMPERGSSAKVGFGYNRHLCRFVEEEWNVENAVLHSDSLQRAVLRLQEFLK